MFKSSLTYNFEFGGLEAFVQGLRDGLLKTEDYGNLTQCETLEDMKLHLASTDYGSFLQNEPSPLTPKVFFERARDKLVGQFNEIRFHAVEPLNKFLDYVTYDYMINNVLKLISAVRSGKGALDLLFKCHPLGMFNSIGVITAAETIDEMYELVLIDSPIGKFFTQTDVDKRDFDEFTKDYIKGLLRKNYLESFYDFVRNLGGITSEVMSEILEFEADRAVLTITRQSCKSKELQKDERKKLYPNFGSLKVIHDELCDAEDDKQIKTLLENAHGEYSDMFQKMEDSNGKISLDSQMSKMEVHLNKLSFCRQFHFGTFYSIVKLREQEIRNLLWIAECLYQNQRDRISGYVPLYSTSGFHV